MDTGLSGGGDAVIRFGPVTGHWQGQGRAGQIDPLVSSLEPTEKLENLILNNSSFQGLTSLNLGIGLMEST